jgi:catechol 2,3-dioxygenase-like lactoylglutathione lyase family enzyme
MNHTKFMTNAFSPINANTILYCKKWQETVDFYKNRLGLPVTHDSDWFIEFKLTETAHISVADEQRASIKSSGGSGITLALQVESATQAWEYLRSNGLEIDPVRDHPWGARVFYFFDPEGHRIEVWEPK